ncbi:MAG: hypothetical protein NC548_58770 [Lachnospiraceae bacterium]|nr:hypothetical protein [Acetatifactor muris]MCM1224335.1 hypothetical protein [Lachnospiraceae bacterium]
MITVNTKRLVSEVMEADEFRMPDMNMGTGYLYGELYRRLLGGGDLHLSEIDFSRFELDDINSLRELHSDMEANAYKAGCLAHALWNIPAMAAASAFI